jgi:alpha-L-fucosidase
MLGSNEPIIWKQSKEGLVLIFPKEKPCDYAFVFKIAFDKMIGENMQSGSSNVVLKHGA